MTDQNELLKNVKMEIRSILLPEQKGLDLTEFSREYRKTIGRPLPFRELGYQNAEGLLKALPDVVYMQWSFQNNYILKAIADKTTEHIQKLVQKQRSSKLRSKPMPRFQRQTYYQAFNAPWSSCSGQNFIVPPRLKNIASSQSSASRLSSLSHHSASAFQPAKSAPSVPVARPAQSVLTPAVPVVLPAQSIPTSTVSVVRPAQSIPTHTAPVNHKTPILTINQEICELVKEHVDGIRSSDLQQAFRKKYSRDINFDEYNFESFEDYLEQVPGLQPKKFNGVLKIVFVDSPKIMSPVPPPPNNNHETNKIYTWLANGESPLQTSVCVPPELVNNDNASGSDDNYYEDTEQNPQVSEKLKQQFREILQRHPRGIFARDFLTSFKVYTGYDFNFKALGHYNLIDFVDTLPDVFTRFQPENCKSDWLFFDATSKEAQKRVIKAENRSKNQKVFSRVLYNQVIANVRKILQGYTEGIFLDQFVYLYQLNCDTSLVVEDFGYDSLEKFLLQIEDEVPLKIDSYTNLRPKIHLAYDATSHIPSRKFHANLHEAPKDAVLPGAKYATEILPSVPKGQYISIFTGTIINPATLWIQLCGKKTSGALYELMDEMELLYTSEDGEDYIMRDQDIVAGAVGAGIWAGDRNWYRICIISVDMDSVLAKFVDYGNSGKIPKTLLRYLRKEFIKLPSQAIRARMAFLFPIGEEWDTKARDRLIEICKDKPIMAEIVDSPEHKDVISLFLCDSTAEDDVYLTLLLVKEGYARYCKEDKPEKPVVENHSSAQNVHSNSSTAGRQFLPTHTDVLQAVNTLTQFYSCISPNIGAEQVLNSFAQSLNINKPQPPSFQYANAPSALAPSPLSRYFGQESGSLLYQHNSASFPNTNSNNQPLPLHLNSMAIKDSRNSYSKIEAPKMPQLAAEANYIKPPTNPSQSMSIMTEDDYGDIFYDDDDDFNEICAEFGCVQKCVQRVELSFDYRIHIILLDNAPYVSAGDLTYLFWPNEASNLILRRVQQNCSYLPSKTVSEEDYPFMFQQLQSLKVKGLLKVDEKYTIALFLLEHVEQILNLFGHPSPTIRSEIKRELIQFDASSDIWKSFSETTCEDENVDDAAIGYTDSEKFFRLCAYDLKATMEGLKYKKFTCEKRFKADPTTKNELEKVHKQFHMYDLRIKEIESFSKLCQ